MERIIREMLGKKNWVVVGANPNPDKFGNKIYKKLLNHGYNVLPVNPVYDEVEGVSTFSSLKEVDKEIDCINVVVSPKRAIEVVKQAVEMDIKYIWFQPGTFNDEVINLAKSSGLNVVYHACVLVELNR